MRLRHLLAALLLLIGGAAAASGLQVAPTMLTLQPTQAADGLWLSNTGDAPIQAQVRVFRWTQDNGEEQLSPSRDLLVSPPMLQIAPGARQLIRVIRTRANGSAAEEAYRVIVDELPVNNDAKKGIQFVLSYSIPVFLASAETAQASGAAVAPQLAWTLQREGDRTMLHVSNSGRTHAQLADLAVVDASGKGTELHPGLLGYVLPGARMRWPLKSLPPALGAGGALEALINGQAAQRIPSGAGAR